LSHAVSSRARGFIALGLLVVLLLGAALSGVFAYRNDHRTTRPFSLTNSGVSLENPDVAKVKAVAEQFALRMDSLDSSDVNAYVKRVDQVLTTRCRTQFDKSGPLLAASVGKVKFSYKGYVRATGITTMDRNSAVVLISHDSVLTAGGGQSAVSAYRWTLTLRKVNGKWLVDQFTDPDRAGQAC
jgi:hypothetical protein